MAFRHPLAFLLGFEGKALHQAYAGEYGPEFAEQRLAEVRALLAAWDRGELGAGDEIADGDTVTGYGYWARTYDEPGNPLIAVDDPIVRELLAGLKPGDALDAACGTGRFAEILAANGHTVTGVDSSPEMLAVARGKLPDATFLVGDLRQLPVPAASVDLVTCGLALPHVPELGPVFAEFARVLRPGGVLVTSDVHWQSLYLGGIAGFTDADGGEARMPASRFLPTDYLTAALACGFEVVAGREPRWPASPGAGGPWVRQWAAGAADATYENTPAAIIWAFRKSVSEKAA